MSVVALLRAEAGSARSTPTPWVLLGASAVMAPLSTIANLATFDTDELAARATLEQAMHASTVATMTFALVAGILAATADLRFGRIDQLLLTSPSTLVILVVKSAVGALTGLVYGVVGSVVAVVTVASWYRRAGVPLEILQHAVVGPLVGVIVAAVLFAVFGVGLGHLVCHQPFALGAGLALLLILQPPLLLGAPSVGRWFPGAAGLALTEAPDEALLNQLPGGLVLALWTAAALAAGGWRLRDRLAG